MFNHKVSYPQKCSKKYFSVQALSQYRRKKSKKSYIVDPVTILVLVIPMIEDTVVVVFGVPVQSGERILEIAGPLKNNQSTPA
jgi:hypothetical protein